MGNRFRIPASPSAVYELMDTNRLRPIFESCAVVWKYEREGASAHDLLIVIRRMIHNLSRMSVDLGKISPALVSGAVGDELHRQTAHMVISWPIDLRGNDDGRDRGLIGRSRTKPEKATLNPPFACLLKRFL